MARYERIYKDWFFHRLPRGVSFADYEAGPGKKDRVLTGELVERMRRELPKTMSRVFDIKRVPRGAEALQLLDVLWTPEIADALMQRSDTDDENNEFKLTLSELAVFTGDVVLEELGGAWHYARMPNFFESVIRVSGFEMLVFQTVMKKGSDDFGHETLTSKCDAFRKMVASRRGTDGQDNVDAN